MKSFLRRRESSSTTSGASGVFAPAAKDAQNLPALVEFLASASWEDGTPRVTGTLLVFVEDGRVKACLNDRSQGQTAFLTCSTLTSALTEIDAALRADSAEWRVRKAGPVRPR